MSDIHIIYKKRENKQCVQKHILFLIPFKYVEDLAELF